MIKFRTMSVAQSTVNRILNVADEIERSRPQPQPAAAAAPIAPAVPDPSAEGDALDQALQTPLGEMPPLEDDPLSDTANALEPILHGGTALDGLIDTVSGQ
ncbi:MAG: hypothetical protein WD795_16335 [Woeseia sp.]